MNQILKPKKGYKKITLNPKYLEMEIPEEWEIVTLDSLTKRHNSGVFKNKEFYGLGVNIVGVSDLYRHNNINGQIFRLVQLTDEEKQDHILEEGNLIYGESSLVRTGIGKTLVVTKKGSGTYFAWHTRRLKINEKAIPNFVYYTLDSTILRNSIVNRATTTALTGVTTKDYFSTKFPLPSLLEQQKISSILSHTDTLIINTQKIIEQTKSLKKGLMQKLLIRGIGHTKFKKIKWLFRKDIEIPEEWIIVKLKQVANVKGGKRLPKGEPFSKNKTNHPYLRVTDFRNNSIYEMNLKYIPDKIFRKIKNYVISSEDVYISIAGTIGLVGLIPKHLDGANLTENACKIIIRKNVNKEYLLILLNFKLIQDQIKSYLGITSQPKLALFRIEKLELLLPIITEQQKIASILSNVDSQIQSQIQYKEKLEELKKSLMQKLLTGEVRVKI